MVEFGVLSVFVVWKKHFSDELNESYGAITNLTLNMIKNRRYNAASRIIQTVLAGNKNGISDSTIKILNINLANAFKFLEQKEQCEKIISGIDWSSAADNFKLCVASLQENFDDFVRLMPIVKMTETIAEEDYALWPVFHWVKDNEKVKHTFKALYGRDLSKQEKPMANDVATGNQEPEEEESTIH